MAKNTQPVVKRAKALGVTPASLGYTGKSKIDTIRNPKAQVRRKQSEYGMQLNEKQKVKFIYGVLEKQVGGITNESKTFREAHVREVQDNQAQG